MMKFFLWIQGCRMRCSLSTISMILKWKRKEESFALILHFFPEGANVNFVSITPEKKVAIRTYERGVEGETLACGTGCAAAAFVAVKAKKLSSPIHILNRASFDSKTISYEQNMRFLFPEASGNGSVEMIGPAELVFQGSVALTQSK